VDLQTATPPQIDEKLADIHGRYAVVADRAVRTEKRANEIAETVASGRWSVYTQADVDARHEEASELRAQAIAILAEAKPYDAEFERRGGWTRAFLAITNSKGHVHSWQRCSTLHRGEYMTTLHWMTDYSGKTQDEIIEAAGERACTVCYPDAPVDKRNRPTVMFSPDEIAAEQARQQRATDKAARAAKAAAKGIVAADGSQLKDHRGWEIKTERAAWVELVDMVLSHRAWGYDEHADVVAAIVAALAAKNGITEDAVRTEMEKKITAKAKRDKIAL
jgi:hypothetical protein